MQFVETTCSAIKSISQRSLALSWQRAAANGRFPEFKQFTPESRGYDPRYMVIWQVETPETNRVFRAMYQGEFVAMSFGQNWVGQSMADVAPIKLRATALAAAERSADTGRAVYIIYSAETPSGARIDCERLLLPFGRAASGVEQIIASMEPFSLHGDVDINMVSYFIANYRITFAGEIDAQATQSAVQTLSEDRVQPGGAKQTGLV